MKSKGLKTKIKARPGTPLEDSDGEVEFVEFPSKSFLILKLELEH